MAERESPAEARAWTCVNEHALALERLHTAPHAHAWRAAVAEVKRAEEVLVAAILAPGGPDVTRLTALEDAISRIRDLAPMGPEDTPPNADHWYNKVCRIAAIAHRCACPPNVEVRHG